MISPRSMVELDDLDIQILADLGSPTAPQWNVRESYANLARRLGVDEETVRLRVKRARERGYMPAWRIKINPHVIGRRSAGFDLIAPAGSTKAEAIARLRGFDGVVLIIDFRDGGLAVILWYREEEALERFRRLTIRVCGGAPRAVWRSTIAKPDVTLRTSDWRILDVMKDDARMDLRDVATTLATTVRTVQRRLKAMTAGRAIMLEGTPDVSKVGGLICDFLVESPEEGRKRRADNQVPYEIRRIGASDTSPPHHSVFGVACENPFQADAVLSKLMELYQVETVRMGIVREFVPVSGWLADEIQARSRPIRG